MPIEKVIVKNTPRQVVMAIHGDNAQTTVSVQEVAHSSQTVDAANVDLAITAIHYQVGQYANIRRSGNIVFNIVAGYDTIRFSEDLGFSLGRNANANVVVNIGAGTNSLFIVMSKNGGYNEANRQTLAPKDR